MTETMKSPLLDGGETMLATISASGTEMVTWSDDKRRDFVSVFQKRAKASQYILIETAFVIARTAVQKKFIGTARAGETLSIKHSGYYSDGPFDHKYIDVRNSTFSSMYDDAKTYYRHEDRKVGGRPVTELEKIAAERAGAVIAELPLLRDAVKIIDAETAQKIDRLEAIKDKCTKLYEEFTELGEEIMMSTLPQEMTIGEFRKMVNDRVARRQELLNKLNTLAREGNELDEFINTKLFKGLPGLSEAIEDVIKSNIARAQMFEQLTRRIEERVMFGDSESAMSILSTFEKDEAKVDDSVRATFAAAMEKLELSASKAKKGGKNAKSRK